MSFRRMRHVKAREFQGCTLALDASVSSMYDATSGGSLVAADGAVARWEDQSGGARHVVQATVASRPLRKVSAQGGLDALLFDGANDQLYNSAYSDSSPRTIMVIGKTTADGSSTAVDSYDAGVQAFIGNEGASFIFAAGGSGGFAFVAKDTGWVVLVGTATTASGTTIQRGRVYASAVRNGPNGLNGIRVGSSRDNNLAYFWNGHIAEIAAFDSSLGRSVSQRLIDARSRKWRVAQ